MSSSTRRPTRSNEPGRRSSLDFAGIPGGWPSPGRGCRRRFPSPGRSRRSRGRMSFHPRLAPLLTREPEAAVNLPAVLCAISGSQRALGRCRDHRAGRSNRDCRGRRLIGGHSLGRRRRDRVQVRAVTRRRRGGSRAGPSSGTGCQSGPGNDSRRRKSRRRDAGRGLAGREQSKPEAQNERECGACHPADHENLPGGSGRTYSVTARTIPGNREG